MAKALVNSVNRNSDLVARCGGEEFGMLLPQTARAGAQHVAQRVLNTVKHLDIAHAASPSARHLSVSIGIACYDEDSACWVDNPADVRYVGDDRQLISTASDLVVAADKALYAAKRAGRAQAVLQEIVQRDADATTEVTESSTRAQRRRG